MTRGLGAAAGTGIVLTSTGEVLTVPNSATTSGMVRKRDRQRPVHISAVDGVVESFGLPTGGYAVAAWLAGRDAGLWTLLGVIWFTAGIRLLVTRSAPSLVLISLIALTVQTVATIATGNLLIILVPLPGRRSRPVPLARPHGAQACPARQLAAEVIGLRSPTVHRRRQYLLPARDRGVGRRLPAPRRAMGELLATIPLTTCVPVWAINTITLIFAGIVASALWFRSVLHRLGISLCFARGA